MNGERLLELYDRMAEAPDAVDRLRRFVLDLAVRGRLVEQDPEDEPTPSILASKRLAVSDSEPFDIPLSWAWVDVGAVAETRLGKMLDKAKNRGAPRRYLRNINVRWFDFDLSDVLEMRLEDSELPKYSLRAGDVLICEGGEPGRAAVWDEREKAIYFQKALHRVRFSCIVDSQYFVNALRASADDRRLAEYFTGTGIKHFTGKGLRAYVFPLPPSAEQRRIVAKIKELMTVCDRLEKARTAQEETRDKLSKAAFARLTAPDASSATFRSDARFAINGLSFLTARGDQIKVLRQNILNLAVRGKLTKQELGEETAAELLKRIVVRKERQEKTPKTRKQKSFPPVTEPPFHIPESWLWVRIREVTSDRGQMIPDARFTYIDVTAIDKNNGVINGPKVLLPQEAPSRARKIVRQGDVIYSCVRPYLLNVAIIEDDYDPAPIASTAFAILNGHGLVVRGYLWIVLRSPYMVERVQQNQRGQAYPAINDADFALLPFPLPPLPEQHRIVKKVDNLMSLCDQLDAGLSSANAIRNNLLGSSLHQTLQRTQLN